jgi:hypothetical protein
MNYVAEPLKQPNQTMAGSSVGLHDLPVHPAHSRETRQHRHWHAVLWAPDDIAPMRIRYGNRIRPRRGCAVAGQALASSNLQQAGDDVSCIAISPPQG